MTQGMSSACTALLVAEMMGAEAGLGWYIQWQKSWAIYSKMYAAIVLICLIILVASNFKVDKDSKASMETVQNKTIEKINLDGFTQLDNLNIKRFLGLDPSQYDGSVYYKSDDAMSAREFIIVKFKDHSQQDAFKETIEKRISSQKGIFEGYAPDQAELLKNAVIDIHGNYALYVVKEDAATMNDQFLKALSEGE